MVLLESLGPRVMLGECEDRIVVVEPLTSTEG